MSISPPDKITVPWATSGLKNAIPQAADPVDGLAGYDQGFTAVNMTPKTAGGIPPFGQDFNGIFFDITKALQFIEAGGSFPYDSAWAASVGGYPAGAIVSRTDNQGFWRNTIPNNSSDPEAGGAGWQPEDAGVTAITMTSSNVTLSPLQAARSQILITGAITANLQLIIPVYRKQWTIINQTTGAFTITAKTPSGSGVSVAQGASSISCDGTNIVGITSAQPDASTTVKGIQRNATNAEAMAGVLSNATITPVALLAAISAANSFVGGFVWLRDIKTLGTPGGTLSSGGWRTRDMQTVAYSAIPGITISANQIQGLPAGRWVAFAMCRIAVVFDTRLRIQNITAASTAIESTGNGGVQTGNLTSGLTTLVGSFVLAATSTVELQIWSAVTQNTSGNGAALNIGSNEIYTDLLLWRMSA